MANYVDCGGCKHYVHDGYAHRCIRLFVDYITCYEEAEK